MEISSPQTDLDSPAIFRTGRGRNLSVVNERTAQETTQRPLPDGAARAAALAAKEADLKAAIATVHVMAAILGSRALVILAALGSGGLFAWTASQPDGWRLAAAICFTAFVFLPALYADRRGAS